MKPILNIFAGLLLAFCFIYFEVKAAKSAAEEEYIRVKLIAKSLTGPNVYAFTYKGQEYIMNDAGGMLRVAP